MAITDEGKKSSAEVFSILIFWFYKLQRLLLFCVNSEFNINFHAGWPNGSADAKVFQEACFKSDLCQDPTRLPPKPPQALLQAEGVEINLASKADLPVELQPQSNCEAECKPGAEQLDGSGGNNQQLTGATNAACQHSACCSPPVKSSSTAFSSNKQC